MQKTPAPTPAPIPPDPTQGEVRERSPRYPRQFEPLRGTPLAPRVTRETAAILLREERD